MPLYALEALFKLRKQWCFPSLETIASPDSPEKIAAGPLARFRIELRVGPKTHQKPFQLGFRHSFFPRVLVLHQARNIHRNRAAFAIRSIS